MSGALHLSLSFVVALGGVLAEASGQNEASAPESATSSITPADPLQLVLLIGNELDLLRQEMGKPLLDPLQLRVGDAEHREVYFQALTLFQKADRFAFEHTREKVPVPEIPKAAIGPREVYEVPGMALERIRRVKAALKITEQSELPPLAAEVQPSAVFLAIVESNRVLNSLLDRQFSPGDVFQQVTVAVAYGARLLDSPGAPSTPPHPPKFERRKRPADVYRKLLDCYELARQLGEISGVPMLRIGPVEQSIENAEPSDVYDIASLLVSELSHLHALLPDAPPPRKTYNPGRKLPAHVYQRAGILHDQLGAFIKRAQQNPAWLGNRNGNSRANP